MRRLLRADLWALRNLVRTPSGRLALLLMALLWMCLGLGGALTLGRLVVAQPVRAALRDDAAGFAPALLAFLLWAPFAVSLAVAAGEVGMRLFKSPSVSLVMVAPVPRRAIVLHAFVRALAIAWILQALLTAPALVRLVWRTRLGPGAVPAHLIMSAVVLVPACAIVTAFVVTIRFVAVTSRARVVLNVLGLIVGVGIALSWCAGLLSGRGEAEALVRRLAVSGGVPDWLFVPGLLPANAGAVLPFDAAMLEPLAWTILAVPALWIATRLHPWALERFESVPAAARAARPGRRRWPATPAASLARKDLVTSLRTRGTIGFLGFVTMGSVLALSSSLFAQRSVTHADAPAALNTAFGLFSVWVIVGLMLAALQGGMFLVDEAKQYELIAASPMPRPAILRGKLFALLLPHTWLLVSLCAAAPFVTDAGAVAIAMFVLGALPVMLVTLGLVVALGTLPALNIGVAAEGARQAGRAALGAILASAPGILFLSAMHDLMRRLSLHYTVPAMRTDVAWLIGERLAVAWLIGVAVMAAGWWIARRNVGLLFGPRR